MNRLALISLLCMAFSGPLIAADKSKSDSAEPGKNTGEKKPAHPVFVDPSKAGPDFAIQGEYTGEIANGKGKLGVQVIALGDRAFTAVILPGGLPGDGWDGTPRVSLDGKTDGEKTVFTGAWSATIAQGVLTGKTDKGDAFDLKKVERVSPDDGAKPPAGAIVLFDGTNVDAFNEDGKMDDRHLLKWGTKTKQKFQNFTLHVEFMLPFKPFGRDQDRGNSGVYIQDRYEIQVLDTFGHPEEFNGCASMYRQTPPKVNMCYPPLRWQTYDIKFTAPRFDTDGKKTANAHITVRHNGVVVQDNTELPTKTGAGQKEGPEPGPIQLQEHHNPVFYRNMWIVEEK